MLLLALFLIVLSTPAMAEPPVRGFDLQGHRGARGLHPENTLEGFRETTRIGVTTLELDTAVTRDGVVVVHHDERLHRDIARDSAGAWLTGLTPSLNGLTWAEIQTYDVGRARPGSAYAERFNKQRGRDGIRIPKLATVLDEVERSCRKRMRYNIETKLTPTEPELTLAPDAFADALVSVIEGAGVSARTTIQSFDWRTLLRVRKATPTIQTACLTHEASDGDTIERGREGASPWTAGLDIDAFAGSVPDLVAAAGCAIWSPHYDDLDRSDVERAHAINIEVIPWTVNEPSVMERMMDLGVDGVISDYPDAVRTVMRRREMPLPEPCAPLQDEQ